MDINLRTTQTTVFQVCDKPRIVIAALTFLSALDYASVEFSLKMAIKAGYEEFVETSKEAGPRLPQQIDLHLKVCVERQLKRFITNSPLLDQNDAQVLLSLDQLKVEIIRAEKGV